MCNEMINNRKPVEKVKHIKEQSDFVFTGNYDKFYKKKWFNDMNKYDLCHHCKVLFSDKVLIKCRNDGVIKCQLNVMEKESKIGNSPS